MRASGLTWPMDLLLGVWAGSGVVDEGREEVCVKFCEGRGIMVVVLVDSGRRIAQSSHGI
jgi:hypothetical protein